MALNGKTRMLALIAFACGVSACKTRGRTASTKSDLIVTNYRSPSDQGEAVHMLFPAIKQTDEGSRKVACWKVCPQPVATDVKSLLGCKDGKLFYAFRSTLQENVSAPNVFAALDKDGMIRIDAVDEPHILAEVSQLDKQGGWIGVAPGSAEEIMCQGAGQVVVQNPGGDDGLPPCSIVKTTSGSNEDIAKYAVTWLGDNGKAITENNIQGCSQVLKRILQLRLENKCSRTKPLERSFNACRSSVN